MSNVQNHNSIQPTTYICKYRVCLATTTNPNSSGGRILFHLTAPIVFTEVLIGQPATKG